MEDDLRPNPPVLIGGAGAIGLISALSFVKIGRAHV